jgi:hypothetical protein
MDAMNTAHAFPEDWHLIPAASVRPVSGFWFPACPSRDCGTLGVSQSPGSGFRCGIGFVVGKKNHAAGTRRIPRFGTTFSKKTSENPSESE